MGNSLQLDLNIPHGHHIRDKAFSKSINPMKSFLKWILCGNKWRDIIVSVYQRQNRACPGAMQRSSIAYGKPANSIVWPKKFVLLVSSVLSLSAFSISPTPNLSFWITSLFHISFALLPSAPLPHFLSPKCTPTFLGPQVCIVFTCGRPGCSSLSSSRTNSLK